MVKTPAWKTPYAIVGVALLAVGGAIAAVKVARQSDEDGVSVPKELTVASLSESAKEGNRGFGQFREVMDREDLTDEQRRQAFRNMGEVRRQEMKARVDEFFAATTEAEQNAILDSQIDEFQRMRDEWRKRREEREKEGEAENDRERMRQMFGGGTEQERKARSESRNPDETARQRAYFTALMGRASARGIQMGGPGGRGPGGRRP